MTQQEIQERLAARDAERKATAAGLQLSEAVRGTPLGRVLADGAAGLNYTEALKDFVCEQWELYLTTLEWKGSRKRAAEDNEEDGTEKAPPKCPTSS